MVTFPTVEWVSQDPTIDPSGSRNINSVPAGFLKVVNTAAGGELSFGTINNTDATVISDAKCVYARAASMGDASGIFNMRFFLINTSAWGAGTYRFLERKELHFQQGGVTLTGADADTPTVVPATTNFLGTIQEPQFPNGQPWMSGTLDNDVTQYAYLAVSVATNVPAGTYGGAGAGSFRYRLLYDFS
jgi:hypothetical protein